MRFTWYGNKVGSKFDFSYADVLQIFPRVNVFIQQKPYFTSPPLTTNKKLSVGEVHCVTLLP